MKYALVGCSRIASNHIRAALANGLEIAAACDILPEKIEGLLARHGLENDPHIQRYTDYRTMFEEKDIGLVGVAAQSDIHADVVLAAIERGIPVIVEKPMAMSTADADAIVRLSESCGIPVCACHQNRFNPSVRQVREAVEDGRFGRMSHGTVHVRWNRNRDYYAQAPWRGTWEHDGGVLMNQCIHSIDLLCWLMNDEIEEVYGVTRNRFHDFIEAEDVGLAILKFRGGAIATVEGTTNVYPKNLEETLYLFGENGTVKLGGKSMDTIEAWEFADGTSYAAPGGKPREIAEISDTAAPVPTQSPAQSPDPVAGHTRIYADMIGAVENGRQPLVSAREGRRAVEAVLAIYRSQKEGRPVKLPLGDFSSRDMKGVFGNG